MAPPTAVAWASILNNVDHSAVPAVSWAFALMSPIERAASGSFKMIMKSPPTNGAMENPIAVRSGTLDRRILTASVKRAAEKLFIVHLLSGAGSNPQDSPVPQPVAWADCQH